MKLPVLASLLGLATAGFIIGGAFRASPRTVPPTGFTIPRPLARGADIPVRVPTSRHDLLAGAKRDPAAVLHHWMRLDPSAADDFALALPDAPARARALEQIAGAWVARDPVAASAWAESLPPSAELDTFAAAIATLPGLVPLHLDTALGWAESITGDELRAQTLGLILDACVARDPAAYIYLVTTPEPSPARKTLFASVVPTR